jgi:hypothetical protein
VSDWRVETEDGCVKGLPSQFGTGAYDVVLQEQVRYGDCGRTWWHGGGGRCQSVEVANVNPQLQVGSINALLHLCFTPRRRHCLLRDGLKSEYGIPCVA